MGRVYGNSKWCRWTIKIDGKDCAIPIYNSKHSAKTSDNDHTPNAIVGTCAGIAAGVHIMTIALTRNGGADCYTGWSATSARDAFFMEAEELNPAGQITTVMRKVKADGRDSGVVNGRSLKFDKRADASQLRLTWATNLRVRAHNNRGGAICNWELRIDGKSCAKPSKIGVSMHSQNDDNDHIPAEVVGWCQGIARGPHTITVIVMRGNSNSDCYTGWASNDYMEVWEPTPAEQSMITYTQRVGTDSASDGTSSVLTTSFTKKSSSSSVRILYYDNLRVIGSGRWCRWEMKVDGKSCAAPLAGSVHTNSGDNDHYPATIVGECPGVAAGKHTINVAVTRSSGADCHTGWTPWPRVMHALIEIQETSPAPCNVPNSNKQPGSACACLPGYSGKITWKAGLPVGSCTSTPTTTTVKDDKNDKFSPPIAGNGNADNVTFAKTGTEIKYHPDAVGDAIIVVVVIAAVVALALAALIIVSRMKKKSDITQERNLDTHMSPLPSHEGNDEGNEKDDNTYVPPQI